MAVREYHTGMKMAPEKLFFFFLLNKIYPGVTYTQYSPRTECISCVLGGRYKFFVISLANR